MRFVGMIMWLVFAFPDILSDVVFTFLHIIRYAPVGIVSMVAGSIIDSSDLVSMLQSIGMVG
jgi:hypothetical protein